MADNTTAELMTSHRFQLARDARRSAAVTVSWVNPWSRRSDGAGVGETLS